MILDNENSMDVYFFTHNKAKFEEVRAVAKEYSLEIKWKEIEYEEIQADTLEEIAIMSCKRLIELDETNKDINFFVEDAGLFIEELKGFPGPYSAYTFQTIENEGILKLLKDCTNRKAEFKSVIAYFDGTEITTFIGITEGEITAGLCR